MAIDVGMDGDIVILDISGDLVSSNAQDLVDRASQLVEKGFRNILLVMNKIHFFDSSGLSACITATKLITDHDGIVVCAQPTEAISKILNITRADRKLCLARTAPDGIKLIRQMAADRKKP